VGLKKKETKMSGEKKSEVRKKKKKEKEGRKCGFSFV
jgi:hypothetical protein